MIKGSISNNLEANLSSHRGLWSMRRWASYSGWCVNLIIKTSMVILNVMRARTGSQCNSVSTGVMWSLWQIPVTTHASVFYVRCSLYKSSSLIHQPARRFSILAWYEQSSVRRLNMMQCTNVEIAGLAHVVDIHVEGQVTVENYTETFDIFWQIN